MAGLLKKRYQSSGVKRNGKTHLEREKIDLTRGASGTREASAHKYSVTAGQQTGNFNYRVAMKIQRGGSPVRSAFEYALIRNR